MLMDGMFVQRDSTRLTFGIKAHALPTAKEEKMIGEF